MKSEWTILVDEREKKPLPFPDHLVTWDRTYPALTGRLCTVALRTRKTRLLTGDYQLEGHEGAVIVERKAHLTELHTNLLTIDGRRKFLAELSRLRVECRFPWILLEGTPTDLKRVRHNVNPSMVRDSLLMSCLEYGVGLHLSSSSTMEHRRSSAEWVASLLISGAFCPPPIGVFGKEQACPPPSQTAT